MKEEEDSEEYEDMKFNGGLRIPGKIWHRLYKYNVTCNLICIVSCTYVVIKAQRKWCSVFKYSLITNAKYLNSFLV